MKPEKILRTIESHLELKPIKMPRIKENPKYLEGQGEGAIVEMEGEPLTVYIKKKNDLMVIAEELTHLADIRSGTQTRMEECIKDWFYDYVLIEALGYYGSKLISPERKPLEKKEYKTQLGKLIKKEDWKNLEKIYYNNKQKFVTLLHEIGYDLGEKVYNYVKINGGKEPALSLLIKNRQKEKPFEVYKRILEEVTEWNLMK